MRTSTVTTQTHEGRAMKSYVFPVVIEQDEDRWRAYIPELEEQGAATWGYTREEASRNIQEVAQMVLEEMLENNESLPPSVTVSDSPVVAVNV